MELSESLLLVGILVGRFRFGEFWLGTVGVVFMGAKDVGRFGELLVDLASKEEELSSARLRLASR